MDRIRALEEELRQAQRLASIGLFASGIAHDFNNLLTVILSTVPLLSARLADRPEVQEELGDIEAAASRGAALTHQLLAFARKQVQQPQPVDLNEMTIGTARLLNRLIGEHIELTTELAPSLGAIWADPAQLEQVLMNLALNARDAMPAGGRLRIETTAVELDSDFAAAYPGVAPGPHVAVTISDTGHGMTPEIMAQVFEPLFTTKPKGAGTGLGLGISHGIVRQNCGHIAVSSTPGEGTTFRLYFPRMASEALSVSKQESPTMLGGTETILLAEDDASVRCIAGRTLRLLGYAVLEAANGAEALAVAETHRGPIHLLITDVIMPQLGGRSLAEQLYPARQELRVLFTSGYTADVLTDLLLHPEVAFLGKPYAPDHLAWRVREILDGGRNMDVVARDQTAAGR
jgi:nitrogen-specific signal transduction histidine kinase